MVRKYICSLFCVCFLFVSMVTVNATAKDAPPPKYTIFEGQAYRWNSQMKKYFPYQTPYQRMQERYLKQQLKNMGTMPATGSQPTRTKWWAL